DFTFSTCCSVPCRPGSSRRAFPSKPRNCHLAANGCMRSSTTVFGLSPAYRRRRFSRGQKGKSPDSEAGARLGFVCHGGSPVTIRTVTDPHFHHNGAIFEIRLL